MHYYILQFIKMVFGYRDGVVYVSPSFQFYTAHRGGVILYRTYSSCSGFVCAHGACAVDWPLFLLGLQVVCSYVRMMRTYVYRCRWLSLVILCFESVTVETYVPSVLSFDYIYIRFFLYVACLSFHCMCRLCDYNMPVFLVMFVSWLTRVFIIITEDHS